MRKRKRGWGEERERQEKTIEREREIVNICVYSNSMFVFARTLCTRDFCVFQDWREVWLRECFWHVLFAFILLIVMIIWRPSANRNRYSQFLFFYSFGASMHKVTF